MKNKRILGIFSCIMILCFCILTINVNASSDEDGYISTYDMKGGLYTRESTITKGATISVDLAPERGVDNASIEVYLEQYDSKKKKWVIVGCKEVDSMQGGNIKFGSKCTTKTTKYRLYLRQYTGFRMSGWIKVKWKK